jgi:hypothetical protein
VSENSSEENIGTEQGERNGAGDNFVMRSCIVYNLHHIKNDEMGTE